MHILRAALALAAILPATTVTARDTATPTDGDNPGQTPESAAALQQLIDCARSSRTDWRATVHDGKIVLCEPPTMTSNGHRGWEGWDAYAAEHRQPWDAAQDMASGFPNLLFFGGYYPSPFHEDEEEEEDWMNDDDEIANDMRISSDIQKLFDCAPDTKLWLEVAFTGADCLFEHGGKALPVDELMGAWGRGELHTTYKRPLTEEETQSIMDKLFPSGRPGAWFNPDFNPEQDEQAEQDEQDKQSEDDEEGEVEERLYQGESHQMPL